MILPFFVPKIKKELSGEKAKQVGTSEVIVIVFFKVKFIPE
jgi:hypothetical protein